MRRRVFGRCINCDADIAAWEDGDGWWHLDGHLVFDHIASLFKKD